MVAFEIECGSCPKFSSDWTHNTFRHSVVVAFGVHAARTKRTVRESEVLPQAFGAARPAQGPRTLPLRCEHQYASIGIIEVAFVARLVGDFADVLHQLAPRHLCSFFGHHSFSLVDAELLTVC